MATDTALAPISRPLSRKEVVVLRDEALAQMIDAAEERLKLFTPEGVIDGDLDAEHARETERMMGAAEVYGACKNCEAATPKPDDGRAVVVHFTRLAMEAMESLRSDLRSMLTRARGTQAVSIQETPDELFLLYILDGICGEDER